MARFIFRLYRDAFSGLPRDIWLLATVALVNRAGSMVVPFIALYLTVERGFTTQEAGRFVALYGIGAVLGSYLGGWLSDRMGAVRAQQASLFLGGVGFLALSVVRERTAIGFTILIVGVVVEAFRPAVMTSFAERAPARVKAKAFALLRLAANLGFGIGPAVGGVLALYSYQWLFIADALTCWAAALLLLRIPAREEPTSSSDTEEVAPRRHPWRDGSFLVFLFLVVLLASALFQVFSTFPLYLREAVGYRENFIGLLLSLNAFLIVSFEMVLIHVVQNRDRMRLAALGALLLCGGLALISLGKAPWFIAFTVVVWTFGEMLALPILNVVVAERADKGYRGQYMGMYAMAYSIAFIVAPVVGTSVYAHFGPHVLWHGIGVMGIVLAASFVALKKSFR
jgi:predicted MFS family arabinose efflux permease